MVQAFRVSCVLTARVLRSYRGLLITKSHRRRMTPLWPLATEGFDLLGFGPAIFSDSGPMEWVRVDEEAVRICHCQKPGAIYL